MRCPFGCGIDVQLIIWEATGKREYLNHSGYPHECKQRQDMREDFKQKLLKKEREVNKAQEQERQRKREPVYKFIFPLLELKDLQYVEHPKPNQSMIKTMCSCLMPFPVWRHQTHYHFDSDVIDHETNNFWDGNCGLYLTDKAIKKYFPQYSAI